MLHNKYFRVLGLLMAAALLLLTSAYGLYRLWEQEPELAQPTPAPSPSAPSPGASQPPATDNPGQSPVTGRQDGVYTLLLVGNDDGNGNTDTLLLAKLDTRAPSLDFVSIPRDTLINEDWTIRKINAVYGTAQLAGESGIEALQAQLRRLTGFEADCYAVVDLQLFVDVVDAMGGVWYGVPQAMDYEDGWQDLYIHLQPGYQKLSGYDAMCLCRYRSGYADGDLGRIRMQQDFLASCARQFVSLGKIPNVSRVVELLSQGLETNLSPANIAFFLRQALRCGEENIRFHTAPNAPAMISGYSYAVLEPEDWLALVNQVLNPYEEPVTRAHVDLVYRSGGGYAATGTLQGAWYYQEPAPAPIVREEPQPEAPPPAEEFTLPEFQLPQPPAPVNDEAPPPADEPLREELPFLELPGNIGRMDF